MRRMWLVPFALILTAASAHAQPSPSASSEPLTLGQLEQMALRANPTIVQAAAAVDAARNRARQAGAWPNPVIGYTGSEIAPGEITRFGVHGVFAEQTILLGGKLRLNRAVFTQATTVAESFVDLQRQRVLSTVRTLYYEALTADRRVVVRERLAALALEAVDVSRQLYNTGAADRPDVLETEIEARRATLDLEAARNSRFAVWQHIAAVVNNPSLTARPLDGSIESAIPELERASTLQALLDQNGAVRAARAELSRAQTVTSQARRVTYPDLFLRGGANYNRERLETNLKPVGWEAAFEAGVSLPLFNRNVAGVAAARAEETRAQRGLLAARTALGRCTELQQALAAAPAQPSMANMPGHDMPAGAAPGRPMIMIVTATDPAKLACPTKVDAKAAAKTTYNGTTYYFCSERDRDEFLKDPAMNVAMMPKP